MPYQKLMLAATLLTAAAISNVCFCQILSPLSNDLKARIHDRKADGDERVIIGDLGGMLVCMPGYYAILVEYSKGRGNPSNTIDSHGKPVEYRALKSFGVLVKFPGMTGPVTRVMLDDYKSEHLSRTNPWLDITVLSGDAYPSLGARANDGLARVLREKSDYWFNNYRRDTSLDIEGLNAYVLDGVVPGTSELARNSSYAKDIYIDVDAAGHVATFVSCNKARVKTGVARCSMDFGLEPEAKARLTVNFSPSLLPKWKLVRSKVEGLFMGFRCRH